MAVSIVALLDTVIELGIKHSEHVYDRGEDGNGSCLYFQNGKPGCIIGQALAKLGVDNETLQKYDDNPGGDGTGIDDILNRFEDDFLWDSDYLKNQEIVDTLNHIQTEQDRGSTWGQAISV